MIKMYIFIALLIVYNSIYAQVPGVDPGSNAPSVALAFEYSQLKAAQSRIKNDLNSFKNIYAKRLYYKDINNPVFAGFSNKTRSLYNELVLKINQVKLNNNVSLIFHRREENLRKLNDYESSLLIHKAKFIDKLRNVGNYGQKLNVYLNFKEEYEKIKKAINQIEAKINLFSRLKLN
jgi:hypothetical protein